MTRSTRFDPAREPLRQNPMVKLNEDKIHGPVSFFNPTQARFDTVLATAKASRQDDDDDDVAAPSGDDVGHTGKSPTTSTYAPNIEYKWTSRNNRKGRHTLVIHRPSKSGTSISAPKPTSHPSVILRGIWRLLTYYPYWDISWLVAYVFTIGSVLWVLNAFFVFLPLLQPSTTFNGEQLVGGGVTAFIGATVFEIGSILLMLEAVNENRAGCFGWAVQQLFISTFNLDRKREPFTNITPDQDTCSHHHQNKGNLVGNPRPSSSSSSSAPSIPESATPNPSKSWLWWPSTSELRNHYIHDLGFLACAAQTFGATIFWISGFTALPGILNRLSPGLSDGIYWTPQVVGGVGFVVSGTLFMLETQDRWWRPAFRTLGWHIGVWNLIGGVGFTLSPAFGYAPASWAQFQASCSTFWGSWAFLIGSVLQLYESLEKNPVEVEKSASIESG